MSTKQINVLLYLASNPGATAADVTRMEWSGRGHNASYDRVGRLRSRRMVARQIGPRRGAGIPLVITALGLAALEKAGAL